MKTWAAVMIWNNHSVRLFFRDSLVINRQVSSFVRKVIFVFSSEATGTG